MSETLWAVTITGALTLAASLAGQLIAARTARTVSLDQQESARRASLLALAKETISLVDELTLRWWRMQRQFFEARRHDERELSDEDIDLPAADLLEMKVRLSLSELRLSTLDPGVQQAAGLLQLTCDSARAAMSFALLALRNGGAPNLDEAGKRIARIEVVSLDLALALQPLTAHRPHHPWWRARRARREEEDVAASVGSFLTARVGNIGQ